MKSSDMQFAEIMNRAETVKDYRLLKKKITIDGIVMVLLIVMMIAASWSVPMLKDTATEVTEQHYGSLYMVTPYLGYVIIAIIAFALGVCMTILCMHLKRLKKEGR
jgi:hypothetical protein